jgi:Fur family ferric uptake transcriptional regulator
VAAAAAHGHTVVCGTCGHAAEFTDCEMSAVVTAAARQTGYRITEHFLQLSGTCPACASGGRKRRPAGDAAGR